MNPFKNTFVCISLVSIQILCIMFINIYSLMKDHLRTLDENETPVMDLKIGAAIESNPVFKTYANYTGTDCGYGFFSPNVGSEFVMSFTVVDETGKVLGEHQTPNTLVQNESRVRFNLCAYPMMERIMLEEPNEIYDKYFEVMMHQIAQNINSTYTNAHRVISETYMHRPATIKESLEGKTEQLLLLERFTFKF